MRTTKTLFYYLMAVFAGCLLPFAFAPYKVWPLAIISPAILVYLWRKTTVKTAFFSGWLYGIGKYGAGIYWIFISVHRFGGANIPFSTLLTLGLILFVALWHAVQALIYHYLKTKKPLINHVFLFPASFVFAEWTLTWLLTGFPWLTLGVSQTNSALAGYTPIFGILGTSFICAFCAGLLINMINEKTPGKKFFAIFVFVFTFILGAYASNIHWSKPIAKPMKVALVQGNIPQSMHWTAAAVEHIMATYQNLSAPYFKNSQLIAWPENAIPLPPPYSDLFLQAIDKEAKKTNTTLMLGIPIITNQSYYNSIMVLGANKGHYYKRHLVPFGEYIPLGPPMRGIMNFLDLPMSSFIPGPKHQPLFKVNGLYIAPLICYEVIYPMLLHPDLPKANILLSISNDSWFGKSSASWQQLQNAQALSLASSRPQLAITDNGITAMINNKGKITHKLARGTAAVVLHANIQGDQGITPWIIWGRWPVLILTWLIFIIFARMRYFKGKSMG